MPDQIPNALSADEWKHPGIVFDGFFDLALGIVDVRLGGVGGIRDEHREKLALIALLNDSLDDSDPRKITRENIETLRWAANMLGKKGSTGLIQHERITAIANALESYLPPEEPGT